MMELKKFADRLDALDEEINEARDLGERARNRIEDAEAEREDIRLKIKGLDWNEEIIGKCFACAGSNYARMVTGVHDDGAYRYATVLSVDHNPDIARTVIETQEQAVLILARSFRDMEEMPRAEFDALYQRALDALSVAMARRKRA